MRKLSIGIFLVLFLGLAATPYFMGITAKSSLEKYVAYVDKQVPALSIHVSDYKSGWLKSEAKIDMTLINTNKSGRKTPINFSFKEKIHHGPILIDKGFELARAYFESDLQFSEKTLSKLEQKVSFKPAPPKIQSDTKLDLAGDYEGIFNVSPFKMVSKKKENNYFEWKGFEINGKLAKDFSKSKGNMVLKGTGFTGKNSTFNMGPLDIQYDLKLVRDHIFVGDVSMTQNNIVTTKGDKEAFSLKKIGFKSKSDVLDDMLNNDLIFNASTINIKDKTYGPFDMKLSVKNLDVKVLAQIQKNVDKANNSALSSAEKQMIMMAVLPSLPTIITQKSELTLDADFNFPEGKISAQGFVKLNGKGSGPVNPAMLRKHLALEFDGSAPASLVHKAAELEAIKKLKRKQMKQQRYSHENAPEGMSKPKPMDIKFEARKLAQKIVGKWEQMGFIVRRGNSYNVKIAVNRGSVVLNGRRMF